MMYLVTKHFLTLQKLHEFSIAYLFGPQAPYLGDMANYLSRTFGKDITELSNKEFNAYLSEYYIEEHSFKQIITYTKISDVKRLGYVLDELGKENILKLAEDCDIVSSLKILKELPEAISEFREEICAKSPRRRSGEGNAIGGFFQNLSARLGFAYAIKPLHAPKDSRRNILAYHLLKNTGCVDNFKDPLLPYIKSETELDILKERIKEWDDSSLGLYSPKHAEIICHFWRNGYLPYKTSVLETLRFHESILVDRYYRPALEVEVGPNFVI